MDNSIKSIVINGADVLGWTAATALARGLQGTGIQITLVGVSETPDESLCCTPLIQDFLRNLGFDLSYLQQTHGMLPSLGWLVELDRKNFPISFDTYLPAFNGYELHQVVNWLKADKMADYSLASELITANAFVAPNQQVGDLRSSYELGMVFDSQKLMSFMQGAAKQLGVKHINSDLEFAQFHCNTGELDCIVLQNEQKLKADLFIDNSGNTKQLSKFTQTEQAYTNCVGAIDSVMKSVVTNSDKTEVYNRLQNAPAGWIETTSINNKRYYSYYYNSKEISDSLARETFTSLFAANKHPIIKVEKVKLGYNQAFWSNNLISIGKSAGHLVTSGVDQFTLSCRMLTRLLEYFPNKSNRDMVAAEFNRLTNKDFSEAKDLSDLCLLLFNLADAAEVSNRLSHIIELFTTHGRFDEQINPLMPRQYWINLLCKAVEQFGYNPVLNGYTQESGLVFLEKINSQINRILQR